MTTAKGHAPASAARNDAIATLIADHRKVKELFKQFEKLKDKDDVEDEKGSLVAKICTELTIHTTIGEEIFYPAMRDKIEDENLMDDALVEHAEAKDLIAQLKAMSPDDDLYDAKVTVLGQQIDHHVKEEEREMFPKAKKAEADTEALGALMAHRRTELKAEFEHGEEENAKSVRGQFDQGKEQGRGTVRLPLYFRLSKLAGTFGTALGSAIFWSKQSRQSRREGHLTKKTTINLCEHGRSYIRSIRVAAGVPILDR